MDWKDLINSPNLSRKAIIVLISIVAIATVIPAPPADGQPLDPQLVRCVIIAIIAIAIICLAGLAAQTVLDWKWPKGGNGAMEELAKKLLPGPVVDPAGGGRAG